MAQRLSGKGIVLAVAAGTGLGQYFDMTFLRQILPAVLFMMLYPAMFDVDLKQIGLVFYKPGVVLAALFMNLCVSPLLIFGLLCLLCAEQDQALVAGLFLYGSVPCGAMVPVFTGILKGDVSLSTAILTLSLFGSLAGIPLWSKCLLGTLVSMPFTSLATCFCFIITVPFLAASVTRLFLGRKKEGKPFSRFRNYLKPISDAGLILFVFTVFSLNGRQIVACPVIILKIAFPVLLFLFLLILSASLVAGRTVGSHEERVSFILSTTPKNNVIAMAMALSAFGADAALAIAIAGPLVQLPFMLGYIKLAKRHKISPLT